MSTGNLQIVLAQIRSAAAGHPLTQLIITTHGIDDKDLKPGLPNEHIRTLQMIQPAWGSPSDGILAAEQELSSRNGILDHATSLFFCRNL